MYHATLPYAHFPTTFFIHPSRTCQNHIFYTYDGCVSLHFGSQVRVLALMPVSLPGCCPIETRNATHPCSKRESNTSSAIFRHVLYVRKKGIDCYDEPLIFAVCLINSV